MAQILFPDRKAALDAWCRTPTGAFDEELVPHLHGQRVHSTSGCHGRRCNEANTAYIRARRARQHASASHA